MIELPLRTVWMMGITYLVELAIILWLVIWLGKERRLRIKQSKQPFVNRIENTKPSEKNKGNNPVRDNMQVIQITNTSHTNKPYKDNKNYFPDHIKTIIKRLTTKCK